MRLGTEKVQGVRYGEEIGLIPKLFLRRTERIAEQGMPDVTEKLLPVEVLSRLVVLMHTFFVLHNFFL